MRRAVTSRADQELTFVLLIFVSFRALLLRLQNQETFLNTEPTGYQDVDATGVAVWNLDRIDQDSRTYDGVYKYGSLTGQGVDVYLLDTGIRTTHEEFDNGRATCPISFHLDVACEDLHSHGTLCAGIIGGRTFGVAKEVNLIGVKVLSNTGSGSTTKVVSAIDWVKAQVELTGRPSVISMSLGTKSVSEVMNNAIKGAVDAGIPVAAAAGNASEDACYSSPGSSTDAIVVAAMSSSHQKPSWSNYGSCTDLFAPGVSIWTSDKDSDTDTRRASGTSMAAPHVGK